jgi:hypothetical protein
MKCARYAGSYDLGDARAGRRTSINRPAPEVHTAPTQPGRFPRPKRLVNPIETRIVGRVDDLDHRAAAGCRSAAESLGHQSAVRWVPTTYDRVRLRHAWADQGLARGDLGTVIDVEIGGASGKNGNVTDRASATVWVTWDRYPGDARFAVAAQLEREAKDHERASTLGQRGQHARGTL